MTTWTQTVNRGGAEFLELEARLDGEKLNYTDEQWALLTQIANYEGAYSASVELAMAGASDDPEYKKRETLREQEKGRLQQRWEDVFGDEPSEL